ncbi:glycosyl hydrolase [Flavobacteriaceae bacterium]|nr:glycosyl hydrolase [Flavobacteriaceae bacterium]MDB2684559.1 glycosyl hydrolase [Flavobacteriaceae bacterium]MDB4256751.1 glycosyl hydrolase [Flavobacteriaceae bacterium]
MKTIFKALFLFITLGISAQQSATESEVVTKALQKKETLTNSSIIKNISFTNIGPTIMSGRVADIDVNPNDPTEFYVGYASGGLWYTKNNGTSFKPVLDNSPTQNIGDIAVDWKKGTIWVGTGEKNSSRSSYAGIGMLKSDNQGLTWEHVGLPDSHHVSRIIINANNPEEVVVGVIGHLYSPNEDRGVFKTIDGGKTWRKTLFINSSTGIIDVVVAPENPNVMYAASWERERKAWNFDGDGNHSAIYKSIDGGDTWKNISVNNGFRNGNGVGRIGLAIYDENIVYAIHDSQFRRKPEKKEKKYSNELKKEDFKKMSTEEFLALTDKNLNNYLRANRFQQKYTSKTVKKMVSQGTVKPIDLAKFLEDANSMLFDTPVEGAEVFITTNGGKKWSKTHNNQIDGLYYSYGYYFGEIRVDPQDKNTIYVLGVPILRSKDGGKTFTSIGKENVHSDHQALWINPTRKGHLVEGNDGGLNISYDDGAHWIKLNSPSVGQFYAIYADNQKPYNVYGGLQDNGVWTASHNAKMNNRWLQTGHNPYTSIMGGDGMQVQVDDRNPSIVYTGSQFGNYFRLDRDQGERTYIQPKHTLGEAPYRFNWQTPILLSKHNQDILYLGSNKLHRSLDKGDTWEAISSDLTTGGKKGNVAYGTLTTISESPFQFGLLYTGSDDGYVHVSKNGGGSWERISSSFPKGLWVSRVIASQHKKERVYVTLNGYRSDDFIVYVYMSDDYGKTWENISNNIPASPVNVIREDSKNPDLLYIGTDNGAYASFSLGQQWFPFNKGLPNVAIHDLVIQPSAKHLIIGTHGRSLYKASIAPLQLMTSEVIAKEAHIFPISTIKKRSTWGNSWGRWSSPFIPKSSIQYYLDSSRKVTINIFKDELLVASLVKDSDQGFNEAIYDLSFSEKGRKAYLKKFTKQSLKAAKNGTYFLPKGVYTVKIASSTEVFEIQ